MASFCVMPRLTKKALKARLEKAHEQWGSLVLFGLPVDVSEEDLRKAEEEAARIESMTDKELEEYYLSPAGCAELAYERKIERELEEIEATPIEQRPSTRTQVDTPWQTGILSERCHTGWARDAVETNCRRTWGIR
jgi:hypothetical protein